MPAGQQTTSRWAWNYMKHISRNTYVGLGLAFVLCAGQAFGQIMINEVVEDERSVSPDTREFVELYNAGSSAVDISGWTLGTVQLSTGSPFRTDVFPSGSTVPENGYLVMGQPSVPNVNYSPTSGEIFPHANTIFELRNPSQTGPTTLIDALGVETFRGSKLANATQEQLDQIAAGQTVGTTATGGWWGQLESNNPPAP